MDLASYCAIAAQQIDKLEQRDVLELQCLHHLKDDLGDGRQIAPLNPHIRVAVVACLVALCGSESLVKVGQHLQATAVRGVLTVLDHLAETRLLPLLEPVVAVALIDPKLVRLLVRVCIEQHASRGQAIAPRSTCLLVE